MNELIKHIQSMNAKTAAWVAVDPKNRWAAMLTDDAAHWEGYGIRTVAELEHYLLVCEVFEGTRSVWGYKPDWSALNSATDEHLKKEAAQLVREANRQRELEEREEREHAEATAAATEHKSGFALGELVESLP